MDAPRLRAPRHRFLASLPLAQLIASRGTERGGSGLSEVLLGRGLEEGPEDGQQPPRGHWPLSVMGLMWGMQWGTPRDPQEPQE